MPATANGITFEYLEAGEGPLALCMHGFPDTPFTYRHLLPALADAGFRAVAPFTRGFAPTELPPLRHHVHTSVMVADQMALGEALGGGEDALLVAHDWGAVGAWGALSRAPQTFGRAVVMNIPPFEIFGENLGTYPQIKKSFYFWYFQMQRVIEERIRQDDFAFIRDIWGDWSPGYRADEDMGYIREALADPDHLRAALGYYWGQFDPTRFGSPEWASEQEAAWDEKGRAVYHFRQIAHGTAGRDVIVGRHEILDSLWENLRVRNRYRANDMSEERSPLAARLEQRHGKVGPCNRDRYAGKPAARSDVENPCTMRN